MSSLRSSLCVPLEMAVALFRSLELKCLKDHGHLEKAAALSADHVHLNRWHNVLPYDHCRVKLNKPIHDTDYVNASRVNVDRANRSYILTQGPLPETVPYFWAMVHQEQSPAIIMLCRLVENEGCKCAMYWPASSSPEDTLKMPTAGLEVSLVSVDSCNDMDVIKRTLDLKHVASGSVRRVTQYQYVSWPDFKVPNEPHTFLRLLKRVSKEHPSVKEHPNVVHCSAGIGRSGTFCLVDSCIEIMTLRGSPMSLEEVMETLYQMRWCREGLIQTPQQLQFSLSTLSVAVSEMSFLKAPACNGVKSTEAMVSVDENEDADLDSDSDSRPHGAANGTDDEDHDDDVDDDEYDDASIQDVPVASSDTEHKWKQSSSSSSPQSRNGQRRGSRKRCTLKENTNSILDVDQEEHSSGESEGSLTLPDSRCGQCEEVEEQVSDSQDERLEARHDKQMKTETGEREAKRAKGVQDW